MQTGRSPLPAHDNVEKKPAICSQGEEIIAEQLQVTRKEDGEQVAVGTNARNHATDTGSSATNRDSPYLQDIIEEQRAEISALRAQIASLTTTANCSTSRDKVQTQRLVGTETDATETRAADLVCTVTEDVALGLAFPALLRGLTTKDDVAYVKRLCETVTEGRPDAWEMVMKSFYEEVMNARNRMSERVREYEGLSERWFADPWYLLYVQWMGVGDGDCVETGGTFDGLRKMLPYIRNVLGFKNVCLLPHYESPLADGGYDVSGYRVREALGGEDAFERFMTDAHDLGLRVATDGVFNHTSTEHEWFQRALAGEERYLGYYIQRNGREKIGEWDREGDIVCRYRDPDGTITERVAVFPDIDRTHGLWAEINGRTYQFYRGFYPFQVDLNLRNADLLTEIFQILGHEICGGVLAKRFDAVAHWVKKPGTSGEGLPECHAVLALLKSFMRHVHCRAVVIPEVVRDIRNASTYAGRRILTNGEHCASEGEAILAFEMQAALRETTYFQTVAPLWRAIFAGQDVLPSHATWLNLLEHHDETYLGFFPGAVRRWMVEYIKSRGGTLFKNGMSAAGRLADCLDGDADRIATAIFVLYVIPGVPVIYAGTEIGARSDWIHARAWENRQRRVLKDLGVYVREDAVFDARELQRGPILRCDIQARIEEKYLPMRTVSRMNELREERDCLREGHARAVDSGDVGVLCVGRRNEKDEGGLLCVANLTPMDKVACVPVRQAADAFGVRVGLISASARCVDLMTGTSVGVAVEGGVVKVTVKKFGRFLLELDKVDCGS